MRWAPLLCSSFLCLGLGAAEAEPLPPMRPALLESGPHSLVNLIDPARLLRRGQKDAALSFSCWIPLDGECRGMFTYRSTPGSLPLAEEVVDKARSARFIAAVYKGEHQSVFLSGTVIFAVVAGRPHLRIFLNQEEEHLKKGDDFIAPQPVVYIGDKFDGFSYPEHDRLSGTVVVGVDTDATGKQLAARLIYVSPPGEGFGKAVMKNFHQITFLPGYLHGQPVACSSSIQFLFKGAYISSYWKND
ncbi:MAG TPA: hypothetical protein VII74_05445 [Chthoniobacterales bacterium]